MSIDRRVTKDIMETLEDGRKGFLEAAEKLQSTDQAALAQTFRDFSSQRAAFFSELEQMAANYGDDIDESGSATAALHRGWMALKDALAGSDAEGVLDVAEQGEDHAVAEYKRALDHDDLSPELRAVLARQFTEVKATHDRVKAARDSASAVQL
jgi:uncharacterized protein (TIGR02284 family)